VTADLKDHHYGLCARCGSTLARWNATVCGVLTRPDSAAAKQAHPDLPRRRTKGMCATCFNAHRRKPTPPRIRECDQCGTPTRPARTPRSEYPGTRARQNGDTCQACYKRERRKEAAAA